MLFFLVFSLLFVIALAQRIAIGAPPEWSTISPGSNITVQVERPVRINAARMFFAHPLVLSTQLTLTGSEEVSIAIGFWPCAGHCADQDMTQVLGEVAYAGHYTPLLISPGVPPFENFTVGVPDYFKAGEVSLNVAHFSLIGVSPPRPFPVREVLTGLARCSRPRRCRS